MDKKRLVFATHNSNKAREIQQLVGGHYLIQTLTDIGCTEDIIEDGKTLEENAAIKSRFVVEQYGLDCFADDTGLEVTALKGAPGVHSARYAGPQRSDEDNIQLLLRNLIGEDNRKAQFRTVISLRIGGVETKFEGILTGEIAHQKSGTNGFGYDPIFIPEKSMLTLAEITLQEKNNISHRAKAMQQLIDFLNKA
jgi:XTP/dITP diphosphohydrolase